MIENQLKPRGITDKKVMKAIADVPRHLFVEEAFAEQAYADHPLPIGEGQTISQPYIVAEMTQAIRLNKQDRVLEIGTGSGYQAAILSQIAFKVYTIETIYPLYIKARKLFDKLGYYNIITKYSDGASGWKEEAPFDAIIVTAGAPEIPQPLIKNLAIGGKMIIPVGSLDSQELIKIYKKSETELETVNLGECRFVKLTGEQGWQC
ncbi:MAG: protein-L-isoaspartate(D-aspartate) O-methyltransferase [Deltaproteobacteria bacterium]|nr:protein-L-isoaspartate(D-aspartate) O-methyltransferase [Deltaproteobacteria bacterium]